MPFASNFMVTVQFTAENAELAKIIYNYLYAVRPFSAFSASSAVNYHVSDTIRPVVFLAGGWADT